MSISFSFLGTSKQTEDNKILTLRDDGIRAMQMNEFPYAEKCLKAALEIKENLEIKLLLTELYFRMRDYEKVLPLLQELVKDNQSSIEIELLLAETQGKLKMFKEEKSLCTSILKSNPQEARALYLLAEAEHGLHEEIMAIAHLTQCITNSNDLHRALFLRAEILKGMKQWKEVLEDANQLVEAENNNEDYLLLQADALAALGRIDEATATYQRVQFLNPFCDKAVLSIGKIYEQTSQWEKALLVYNEAIELRPNFAAAYRARGGVKKHLNDFKGATDDLKKSLELAPEITTDYDGEYTRIENQMNERYKRLNPYAF